MKQSLSLCSRSSGIHLQRGQEGALRDFHLAELPHALLALFLLLQQLALARNVPTVALDRKSVV